MATAWRLVVVTALALLGPGGGLRPAAGAEGTPCTFEFVIVLDPGLSMEPTTGTHHSDGPGSIDCDRPVNGHAATGTGTLGEEGPYGTDDPDSCTAGGEGTGTDYLTIPTAGGPQKIASEFTVTFGKLSNQGGLFHGEFTGTRFSGTFEFTAVEGDCVTAPVTKALVQGRGLTSSHGWGRGIPLGGVLMLPPRRWFALRWAPRLRASLHAQAPGAPGRGC